MARRKTQPETVRAKCALAERLRDVRLELYGDRGGPKLARQLGLPIRTWYNYEAGVTVPAEVVLKFVELTSVEPQWLLNGHGPRFRDARGDGGPGRDGDSVEDLLRVALRRLEARNRDAAPAQPGPVATAAANGESSLPCRALPPGADTPTEGEWTAATAQGRCVRVEGDAMEPILKHGAYVAFSDAEETPDDLDDRLVVAWIEGKPLVRWLRRSGRFLLLCAENAKPDGETPLIDLADPAAATLLRRVLWVSTPHN